MRLSTRGTGSRTLACRSITTQRRQLHSPSPTPDEANQIIHHQHHQQQDQSSSSSSSAKRKKLRAAPGMAGRQYLTHPGVPGGTLFEREDMAARKRMVETNMAVQKHLLGKRFGAADEDLAEQGEDAQNRIERGRRTGVASLVEERIQLSMIRGEFENLEKKGQPLERERTPGLDRTTDLFMDVLQRNGVLPAWIQRQKKVLAMTDLLRRRLEVEYARACMDLNPELKHAKDEVAFTRVPSIESFSARCHGIASVREDVSVINSEILTYNISVPAVHLQRLKLQLDDLVGEAAMRRPSSYQEAYLMYRAADREGLLGVTALMEHRLDFFSDDGTMYVGGGGAQVTTYWQGDGGGSRYGGRRKRDAASDHVAELLMIPVDALSKALARMFSI